MPDETPKIEPAKYEDLELYANGEWFAPIVEDRDWRSRIADILLSENLIVLTGLGTSLCLNTPGTIVAPKMNDLWEAVAKEEKFHKILASVGYEYEGKDVEALLSRCQMHVALNPDDKDVEEFISFAEQAIYVKCDFPKEDVGLQVHEMFLRKVARRSIRQPRMKLFTTNYDLCFERAASRTGFITIDGFGHSNPQAFDGSYFSYDFVKREAERDVPDFIPNVFQFYKLHGSVDWVFGVNNVVIRGSTGRRAMIFPRYGKFESSYQQPFFEMMARLQMALRQPNTGLLVIGYGCRDKHLNEPLLSAVRANVGLKFALVDPCLNQGNENDVHATLKGLIDGGDSRLMLLSTSFESFAKYIPDLVAETEQEAHFGRTRKL